MAKIIGYIWASPVTLVGLVLAAIALCRGGHCTVVDGVMEVKGGGITRWFRGRDWAVSALTLGHVVIGQHQLALDSTRAHERMHVRQFERWGPLLIPLYLLAGVMWGHDQNPFEVGEE